MSLSMIARARGHSSGPSEHIHQTRATLFGAGLGLDEGGTNIRDSFVLCGGCVSVPLLERGDEAGEVEQEEATLAAPGDLRQAAQEG